MRELSFFDLVVARILWDNRSSPPTQRELFDIGKPSLINEYLDEHNIGEDRASRIRTNPTLIKSIRRLRAAGLLTPEGRYIVTGKSQILWDTLDDDPHDWPQWIPIQKGRLRYDMARNLPRIRV